MGNTYTQNQRHPSAGQRQEQGAWNQRVFYSQIQGEVCLSQAVTVTKICSSWSHKPKYFQMYLEGQLAEKSPAPHPPHCQRDSPPRWKEAHVLASLPRPIYCPSVMGAVEGKEFGICQPGTTDRLRQSQQ